MTRRYSTLGPDETRPIDPIDAVHRAGLALVREVYDEQEPDLLGDNYISPLSDNYIAPSAG